MKSYLRIILAILFVLTILPLQAEVLYMASPGSGTNSAPLWESLHGQLAAIKTDGYTGLWLPCPLRINGSGYEDPYDLGSPLAPSPYGEKAALLSLVSNARRMGLTVSFSLDPGAAGMPDTGTDTGKNFLLTWVRWFVQEVGADGLILENSDHLSDGFLVDFYNQSGISCTAAQLISAIQPEPMPWPLPASPGLPGDTLLRWTGGWSQGLLMDSLRP